MLTDRGACYHSTRQNFLQNAWESAALQVDLMCLALSGRVEASLGEAYLLNTRPTKVTKPASNTDYTQRWHKMCSIPTVTPRCRPPLHLSQSLGCNAVLSHIHQPLRRCPGGSTTLLLSPYRQRIRPHTIFQYQHIPSSISEAAYLLTTHLHFINQETSTCSDYGQQTMLPSVLGHEPAQADESPHSWPLRITGLCFSR